MALGHSPSIVRNGLVFYYDINNRQKSWRGAPTTNLVNPSWASWSIDGSGQGNIGTRTISNTYECTITDSNANTRQSIYIESGIIASTTYTFSVQYKKIYGAPTLRFQIQAYNGNTYLSTMSFATTAQLGISDIDGWQTAKITVTTPANTNRILWFMQDGDDYTTYTHSFSLRNVQCEQNSFATPFVNGTRSNTQAILDLTNNNTVTANSLSYSADGTFSFNGVDSYIETSLNPNLDNNRLYTFELWFWDDSPGGFLSNTALISNYGAAATTPHTQLHILDTGGITFRERNSSSVQHIFSYTTNICDGTWKHIVYTATSSNLILYVNGVLVGSTGARPGGVITSGQNIVIGSNHLGRFQSCKISAARIYLDKALSATEVLQNFNAQRGIYGV